MLGVDVDIWVGFSETTLGGSAAGVVFDGASMTTTQMQAIAAGAVKDLAEARQIVRNSFDTKIFEPNPSEAIEAARTRFNQL